MERKMRALLVLGCAAILLVGSCDLLGPGDGDPTDDDPANGDPTSQLIPVEVFQVTTNVFDSVFAIIDQEMSGEPTHPAGLSVESERTESGMIMTATFSGFQPEGEGGPVIDGALDIELAGDEVTTTVTVSGTLTAVNYPVATVTFTNATLVFAGGNMPESVSGIITVDGETYLMADVLPVIVAVHSFGGLFEIIYWAATVEVVPAGVSRTESAGVIEITFTDYQPESGEQIPPTFNGSVDVTILLDEPPHEIHVEGSLSVDDWMCSSFASADTVLVWPTSTVGGSPPESGSGTLSIDGIEYPVDYLIAIVNVIVM